MRRFQLIKKGFKQRFWLIDMFIPWKVLLLWIWILAVLLLTEMSPFPLKIPWKMLLLWMSPSRSSFGKSVPFLSQNKSPPRPNCPWFVLGWSFCSAIPCLTLLQCIIYRVKFAVLGNLQSLVRQGSFYNFNPWTLKEMAHCTVFRKYMGFVYYSYDFLIYVCFLKGSFQYLRHNIL